MCGGLGFEVWPGEASLSEAFNVLIFGESV